MIVPLLVVVMFQILFVPTSEIFSVKTSVIQINDLVIKCYYLQDDSPRFVYNQKNITLDYMNH